MLTAAFWPSTGQRMWVLVLKRNDPPSGPRSVVIRARRSSNPSSLFMKLQDFPSRHRCVRAGPAPHPRPYLILLLLACFPSVLFGTSPSFLGISRILPLSLLCFSLLFLLFFSSWSQSAGRKLFIRLDLFFASTAIGIWTIREGMQCRAAVGPSCLQRVAISSHGLPD